MSNPRQTARAVVVIAGREVRRNGHGREVQVTVARTYIYEGIENANGGAVEQVVDLQRRSVPWVESDPSSWGEAWYEVFDLVAEIQQNVPLSLSLVVDVRGLAEGPSWGLEMLARSIGRELRVEVYSSRDPVTPRGSWFVDEYGEQLGLWS